MESFSLFNSKKDYCLQANYHDIVHKEKGSISNNYDIISNYNFCYNDNEDEDGMNDMDKHNDNDSSSNKDNNNMYG